MEQDLLARFTGDSGGQRLQCQSPQSPPSPTLSLCVGFDEEQRIHQAGSNVVACSCPSSSGAPFLSRLVSVVVPGHPATAPLHQRRPTDLPAACAGARPQTAGPTRGPGSWSDALPPRPSMAAVPCLQPVGSTTSTRLEQCRCDASSHCMQLMQGLDGDLDRARAQVALLTCEKESLRHRLKRAVALGAAAPSTTARLQGAGLRCRSCRVRPATVLLVPREHLCFCRRCSDDPAVACWVCSAAAGLSVPPAAPAPAPR
jgi:hypothetical protein